MFLKILMLVVFFAVLIGVGVACRRQARDVKGFVLGGRNVGPWLTAFAYGTSYFSAVIFIGYAGQFGWKYGIAATWIGLGNAFLGSLLAWSVLGRRTRLMTQHLGSATMPEFFGARFQSKGLKIAASVIIFVFMIPYTASLFNGLSRLFAMAFSVDYTVCILVMAALTGIYVIAGGYMATAINDFIQGIIMLIGIVAVIAAVLNLNGGFMGSLAALSNVTDAASSNGLNGAFTSFFGPEPFNLLCVVVLTSFGTWGMPQMVQKFYAIKSENAIRKGMIISTLFALIVAGGCYFLGGFGRLFLTSEQVAANGYDAIIPTMLENLPNLLIGVVVILVLSASMSTLSGLVLASSSTLTIDCIKGALVKDMSEKKQLLTMRLLIVFFILISVVLAIVQYKRGFAFIAQLMGVSWGAMAGAFLAPLVYGLYWKRTTRAGVLASFLFGVLIMCLNILFRSSFPSFLQSPINCGAFAMVAGMVLVPVVSLLTRKPKAETVEPMFACYEQKVIVSAGEALGDAAEEA